MKSPFIFINSFKDPEGERNVSEKNAGHVEYIGTRPGVDKGEVEITPDMDAGHIKYMDERPGSHGLFSQEEGIPNMKEIQKELLNHKGLSWRWILSLEEGDAVEMGYTDRKAWEKMVRATMKDAAAAMGIPESNLRWVAAFHGKKGHPHVHVMFWEKEPHRKVGELSEGEIKDVKRIFVREMDAGERTRLEAEKTALRDLIRDTVGSILNPEKGKEVLAFTGENPGIEPLMTPDTKKQLIEKLNELATIMPGRGRIALKYMPPAVKEKAREISAWLLMQPGFLNSTEKYKDISAQLAKYYVKKEEKLDNASDRAFLDIRDRVAQLVLKGAVDVQKVENIIEQKPEIPEYETVWTIEGEVKAERKVSFSDSSLRNEKERDLSKTSSGSEGGRDKSFSDPDETADKLWRTVYFSLGREYRNLNAGFKLRKPQMEENFKNELLDRLYNIAMDIPDQKGKPAYAYLPEELKKQVRETAEWLLNRPELQNRFNELENREGLTRRISEQIVSRAYDLLPRDIPKDIKLLIHEGRREMVLQKMLDANVNLIEDDYEEAVWTAGVIYRAMLCLEDKEDRAWEAAENFAAKAGLSEKDIWEAIHKEIKRMEYIQEKDLPVTVSRDDWQRMTENLGLKEEEFLRPWFGIKEKDESEREASQKLRDELGVTLIDERIAGAVAAFENSCFHPEDPQELRWAITTIASTLKAMNIDEPERARIVRSWCQRSGVKITEAKLRDVLDRTTISDTDIWLGKRSWARLMKNLGMEEGRALEGPWQVGKPMPLSERIAGRVWKSVWKSLERERSKVEAQSKYASLMAERESEMKSKQNQRTDAAIDRI